MVGKNNLHGKNEYKDAGIIYSLFLAPKKKNCLTINKYCVFGEHQTFNWYTTVSENLYRKEFMEMFDGDELIAKVPSSWKEGVHMVL